MIPYPWFTTYFTAVYHPLSKTYSPGSTVHHPLFTIFYLSLYYPLFPFLFPSFLFSHYVPYLLANSSSILLFQISTILIASSPLSTSPLIFFSSLPFLSFFHAALSIIHYPPSTIHYSPSTIHYPLFDIHYPISTIHPPGSIFINPETLFHSASIINIHSLFSTSYLPLNLLTLRILPLPLLPSVAPILPPLTPSEFLWHPSVSNFHHPHRSISSSNFPTYFSSLPFPSAILPSQSFTIHYPISTIHYTQSSILHDSLSSIHLSLSTLSPFNPPLHLFYHNFSSLPN